jgi:hypothetical protein
MSLSIGAVSCVQRKASRLTSSCVDPREASGDGTVPRPDTPAPQYHPDFPDRPLGLDVTVTLVSREKTMFCISANVLKAASRVFETTLSLPQPEGNASSDPVILDEDSTTIEGLLRMITGREFPPLDTIENIESLVLAANKWEMPGPLSILKMVLLRDTSFAEKHPIRLYWLGCRLKWVALVQLAAKFSCNYDIYYHNVLDSVLDTLDPGDLLRLVRFHRGRRDRMREYFVGTGLTGTVCTHSAQYQDLCAKYLEYMDHNPPGKPLMEGACRNLVAQSNVGNAMCSITKCSFRPLLLDSLVWTLMEQWGVLPQDISTS